MLFGVVAQMSCSEIDSGAYGKVVDGQDHVVKLFFRDNGQDGISWAKELDVLRSMNHPHIVRVNGVVDANKYTESPEQYYELAISFEKAKSNLTPLCGKIGAKKMAKIAAHMLLGLEALHSQRIMHRDIKPENVLIFDDHLAKLCDFGFSHHLCFQEQDSTDVVTTWYRPPELAMGHSRYDYNADVWSMGCVIYELIMGRPLICPDSSDNDEILKEISTVIQSPLSSPDCFKDSLGRMKKKLKTKIGEALCDLVSGMLKFNPSERFHVGQCLEHHVFDQLTSVKSHINTVRASHGIYPVVIWRSNEQEWLMNYLRTSSLPKRVIVHAIDLFIRIRDQFEYEASKLMYFCMYLFRKYLASPLDRVGRVERYRNEYIKFEEQLLRSGTQLYQITLYECPAHELSTEDVALLCQQMFQETTLTVDQVYVNWKQSRNG